MTDQLNTLTNEIEQGFMQRNGWKTCRYLLGKLIAEHKIEIKQLRDIIDKQLKIKDNK